MHFIVFFVFLIRVYSYVVFEWVFEWLRLGVRVLFLRVLI